MEISAVFDCPPSSGFKIEIRNSVGRLLERLKMPTEAGGRRPVAATLRYTFTSAHPFVRVWFLHLNANRKQAPFKLLEGSVEILRDGRPVASRKDILS